MMLDPPDPSIISVGTFELTEPFRLTVLTEVGSDPELTLVIAQGWQELKTYLAPAVILDVVWVGATTEQVIELSAAGFQRVCLRKEGPADTWNEGVNLVRAGDPGALILCEANGIFDLELVTRYVELLLDGYEGVALFDLYVADPRTGRSVYWRGHTGARKGWWLLTGACFSRSWMEQLDWSLWSEDASDLESALTTRVDPLANSARTAGEHRVCGVQGWQMHPLVLREDMPEVFFEQSGEAADVRPCVLSDLLTHFGTGAFATRLYRTLANRPHSVLATGTATATQTLEPADVQSSEWGGSLEDALAEGERAFDAGELETARRVFERALSKYPGHPEVLNNLGVVRHTQEADVDAERLFLKALFLNEGAIDPVISLIHMAQGDGRHSDALLYVLAALIRTEDAQFIKYAKASLLLSENPELNARVTATIERIEGDSGE